MGTLELVIVVGEEAARLRQAYHSCGFTTEQASLEDLLTCKEHGRITPLVSPKQFLVGKLLRVRNAVLLISVWTGCVFDGRSPTT